MADRLIFLPSCATPLCSVSDTVVVVCALQAMSRPFAAGADRLADLETVESPVSGCPVLADAHATMDCSVVGARGGGCQPAPAARLFTICVCHHLCLPDI